MSRRTLLAATAIALLLVPHAKAQHFKSGVDLVRVDALVTDNHRPLTGLRAGDFELRDNGVLQTLDSAALETLPLSIVFVLDTSGSVAGAKMENLAAAVGVMMQGLRGQDRAGLVTFSHRVWERMPLGSDFGGLQALVSHAEASGGTALHDAVYAGLALTAGLDTRPLIIAFSDGLDNASWLSAAAVEGIARRSGAVVYGVAVAARTRMEVVQSRGGRVGQATSGGRPEYMAGQTAFLDSIASTTGGRVLRADTTENLPRAFDEILREFRTRYVLAYSPRGVDGTGWHTLDVRVKNRRAEVKARRGYER